MFGALKALSNSEKAVAIGILIIAATVLVFTGQMTLDQWTDYTKFMAVTYVGGKTIQGGVDAFTKRKSLATPAADPDPVPPAADQAPA